MDEVYEAIEALKNGEIIIVIDDEDRENEGDFICAAEYATPDNINFMATEGKGLICLPISEKIASDLEFDPMISHNTDNHKTAFTVSIDHIDTTTGISAFERSHTIMQIVKEGVKASDFRRPGHLFPLIAKENGVIERNGHTEATVDLMKLSGLKECGVCCEIMNEDGTMMKLPKLIEKSKEWGLKIISIESIVEYIKKNKVLIKRETESVLPTQYGDFKIYGYKTTYNNEEHIALVKGDVKNSNALCRIHSECLTGDTFKSLKCDCGEQLNLAMQEISNRGSGIIVYLKQEGRGIGLINKLRAYELQEKGFDTIEANIKLGFLEDEREYFLAAGILRDLEVENIEIMTNNPDKINKLTDAGINITKRVPIEIRANEKDMRYLKTKKEKMGHYLRIGE